MEGEGHVSVVSLQTISTEQDAWNVQRDGDTDARPEGGAMCVLWTEALPSTPDVPFRSSCLSETCRHAPTLPLQGWRVLAPASVPGGWIDESVYFQALELGIPLAQICKYMFSSINFYW